MNREPVQQLMDACNRREIESALAVLAEDAVYHNMPLAPVRGVVGIREVLGPFLTLATEVDCLVHRGAEGPQGMVTLERSDSSLIDGSWLIRPVLGGAEVA